MGNVLNLSEAWKAIQKGGKHIRTYKQDNIKRKTNGRKLSYPTFFAFFSSLFPYLLLFSL
jgi:hypothetical protein